MESSWQKIKLKRKTDERRKELETHFGIKSKKEFEGSRKMPESTQSIEKLVSKRPNIQSKKKSKWVTTTNAGFQTAITMKLNSVGCAKNGYVITVEKTIGKEWKLQLMRN